ncbi:MAG: alanine--tRNA ligase, partial [Duncaniella sp.]|nr:alanine--tRNA ligase [Duncaniella sp.]
FTPLIDTISRLSGKEYGKDRQVDIAMRVIADHVRTIAFSIADSQLPGNAKAGYVIRRILRRAVRYAYTFLDQKQAFMYKLVNTLIDSMGEAYPEIAAQRELIMKVIKEEEDAFLRTLDKGISILDNAIQAARKEGKTEISGKDAFVLYDTYGFPLDLTELILKENGMTLDKAEFDKEMEAQKTRARNAAAVEATDWVVLSEGETEFVGYDSTSALTRILRYRNVKQKGKSFYQIVLSVTPFYAEMGGQVGDSGWLVNGDEKIEVYDTKRENGQAVHLTTSLPADVNAEFEARINETARRATECNHSATHLLHAALRQVLGTHVEQKGSFVSPNVLRFDFSHFQKLTPEEIRAVEHIANANVRKAIPLDEHRSLPIAEARAMGAMALFGEKYGEEVRVIKYGDSVELCGGTHVPNTGNIGIIRIVSESSIAAGIRRIEAITGEVAEEAIDSLTDTLRAVGEMFHNAPDIRQAIRKAIDENAELRKEVEEFMKERVRNVAKELLESAESYGGMKIVSLTGVRTPDMVKNVAFLVRQMSSTATAFIAATADIAGKPLLTVALTDDLVSGGLNASTIVRNAAKAIKGGGGGQPGFAQAGGKDADGLSIAFTSMHDALKGN